MYEPGGLEKFGDQILSTVSTTNDALHQIPLRHVPLINRGLFIVEHNVEHWVLYITVFGYIPVSPRLLRHGLRSNIG